MTKLKPKCKKHNTIMESIKEINGYRIWICPTCELEKEQALLNE